MWNGLGQIWISRSFEGKKPTKLLKICSFFGWSLKVLSNSAIFFLKKICSCIGSRNIACSCFGSRSMTFGHKFTALYSCCYSFTFFLWRRCKSVAKKMQQCRSYYYSLLTSYTIFFFSLMASRSAADAVPASTFSQSALASSFARLT